MLLLFLPLLLATSAHAWSGWGGGPLNNRWAQSNTFVSSTSISNLGPHCNLTDAVGVSATPVISGDIAYYPTWSGTFVAANILTCAPLWEANISSILPASAFASPSQGGSAITPRPLSRTSPQISGDVLFLGTQLGAFVLALNRTTGKLLAFQQVHSHPLAIITQSPTFDATSGLLFVGVSSMEHVAVTNPSYGPCCSFYGTFSALSYDASSQTFSQKWVVPTIPAERLREGWAGAAIWGSQPSILNGMVFIGTGNTYSVPSATVSCQKQHGAVPFGGANEDGQDPCLPGDILQDSVVAVDIATGKVKWKRQFGGIDAFSIACGYPGMSGPAWGAVNTTVCPQVPGPDADFGMAPAVVRVVGGKDRLVLGRKNGMVYCVDAEDGTLLWKTAAAPPGVGGGVSWGVAADAERVYYGSINTGYLSWEIGGIAAGSNKTKVDRGFYGALSVKDGSVVWQTAVPKNGIVMAPPTVVGDVVLVARTGQDPEGTSSYDMSQGGLVVLHAVTGRVLRDQELPTNMHSGVAVRDNYLLFGTGYSGSLGPGGRPVSGGFNVFKV